MSWSTSAWILYSVAMTSRDKPAELHEIIAAADFLNHAIPTLDELQRSLGGLIEARLVTRENKCYRLTKEGSNLIEKSSSKQRSAHNILSTISTKLKMPPKPPLDQTITEEKLENSYREYRKMLKHKK